MLSPGEREACDRFAAECLDVFGAYLERDGPPPMPGSESTLPLSRVAIELSLKYSLLKTENQELMNACEVGLLALAGHIPDPAGSLVATAAQDYWRVLKEVGYPRGGAHHVIPRAPDALLDIFRRFNEASAEIDHVASQIEASIGAPIGNLPDPLFAAIAHWVDVAGQHYVELGGMTAIAYWNKNSEQVRWEMERLLTARATPERFTACNDIRERLAHFLPRTSQIPATEGSDLARRGSSPRKQEEQGGDVEQRPWWQWWR